MEQLVRDAAGKAIYTNVVRPAVDMARLTKNAIAGATWKSINRIASVLAKRTRQQRLIKQQQKRSTMKYETPIVLSWTVDDFAPVAEQAPEGVLCFAKCHCTESQARVCYTHK